MFQLTDATVLVNNEAHSIVPNSLVFNEGLGEQQVRAMSAGGGKTEQVYARNLESNVGMVKFELPTTPRNIEIAKQWKQNGNGNVVAIAGTTPDGDVTRTFTQAALTNNYEIEVGTETSIEIEFHSNPAI